MTSRSQPVACSLSTDRADRQLLEWSDLRCEMLAVERLPDGVRLRLPLHLAGSARDLALRESQCCAFLTIETCETDSSFDMTITSANPDGVPVVHLLAGLNER